MQIKAMRNIVFATDFLESSRLALDYAVAFSHHYAARLIIVHAFELSHEAEEAEILSHRASISRENALARLQAFATGVRRVGVNTEIDLREGEPCAAILTSAAENKADLLVLGTHGIYRGLQHALVGSNAEKVLLSAGCPTQSEPAMHERSGSSIDAFDTHLRRHHAKVEKQRRPKRAAREEQAMKHAWTMAAVIGLAVVQTPIHALYPPFV